MLARADQGEEKRLVGISGAERGAGPDDRRVAAVPERAVGGVHGAGGVRDAGATAIDGAGKIDRGALPAPEASRLRLAEEYVAPRTWQEKELAEIRSQCLGVEPIGIHDNFALGGDSTRQRHEPGRAIQVDFLLKPCSSIQRFTNWSNT